MEYSRFPCCILPHEPFAAACTLRKVPVSWGVAVRLVAFWVELYNPKIGLAPFGEENKPLAFCCEQTMTGYHGDFGTYPYEFGQNDDEANAQAFADVGNAYARS